MSGYDWSPLVEVIADMDGLAARLLERHRDDGTGRCRVCGSGGQTGRYRWPCAIRELAVLAGTRQAERRLHGGDAGIRSARPATGDPMSGKLAR